MKKTFFLLILYCSFSSADTIDKKKILEIIKAAKKHQNVKIDKIKTMNVKQPIVVYKVKKEKTASTITKDKNIIVYRKRKQPAELSVMMGTKKPKIEYGTLPMLGLSSDELRRKYEREIINHKSLFTTPQPNSTQSKEKTTATKIYF